MQIPVATKGVKAAVAGVQILVAGLIAPLPAVQPASAQSPHARIAAVYAIRFAGIKLGKFKIWSNLNADSYSMRGKGSLKFITGMLFEIEGGTTTTGAVTKTGPQPSSFTFDFKTKKHSAKLAMMFEDNAVTQVMARPPFSDSPKVIPVTADHVKGVLDPLSAIFFTARTESGAADGTVCPGRIPVFDGRQRFDLQLIYKKTVKVKKRGKGGYRGVAVVCQIKYIPIAGYKPDNSGIQFMAASNDIEVWLIKVPRKSMYVPYHVKIPTPYGTASATTKSLNVEFPGENKITLIR